MAAEICSGNAAADGAANGGSLLGHFLPRGDVRRSTAVEIKWGDAGDERAEWVTGEERTTAIILVSGRFRVALRDRSVVLASLGDYVVSTAQITRGAPRKPRSWSASAGRRSPDTQCAAEAGGPGRARQADLAEPAADIIHERSRRPPGLPGRVTAGLEPGS
jgi:hypothetical protein